MRIKDNFQCWVASKLPKWIVMRATVRLAVYATTGKYSNTVVPELTVMEAIRRWNDEPGRDREADEFSCYNGCRSQAAAGRARQN